MKRKKKEKIEKKGIFKELIVTTGPLKKLKSSIKCILHFGLTKIRLVLL